MILLCFLRESIYPICLINLDSNNGTVIWATCLCFYIFISFMGVGGGGELEGLARDNDEWQKFSSIHQNFLDLFSSIMFSSTDHFEMIHTLCGCRMGKLKQKSNSQEFSVWEHCNLESLENMAPQYHQDCMHLFISTSLLLV